MIQRLEILPRNVLSKARLAVLSVVAVGVGVIVGPTISSREVDTAALSSEASSVELAASSAPSSADQPIRSKDSNSSNAEGSDGERPSFDVLSIDTTGNTVIAGRSAPNDVLELRVDGQIVAQTKADRLGSFEISPPPLRSGVHRLELANPSNVSTRVQIEVPKTSNDELQTTNSNVDVASSEQGAAVERPDVADPVPLPPELDRTRARGETRTTRVVHNPPHAKPFAPRPIPSQTSLWRPPSPRQMDGPRGTTN
jgi:hypothetical protein